MLRIIRELIEFQPKSFKTNISEALQFLSRVTKKKAIVFMLSDFMDKGYEKPIQIAARKHDITGIRIYDKKETELPNLGYVMVKDAETGALMRVNTASSAVRNEYAKQYHETVNYFETLWQKSGAGVVSCRADESYTQKLLGYFKNR